MTAETAQQRPAARDRKDRKSFHEGVMPAWLQPKPAPPPPPVEKEDSCTIIVLDDSPEDEVSLSVESSLEKLGALTEEKSMRPVPYDIFELDLANLGVPASLREPNTDEEDLKLHQFHQPKPESPLRAPKTFTSFVRRNDQDNITRTVVEPVAGPSVTSSQEDADIDQTQPKKKPPWYNSISKKIRTRRKSYSELPPPVSVYGQVYGKEQKQVYIWNVVIRMKKQVALLKKRKEEEDQAGSESLRQKHSKKKSTSGGKTRGSSKASSMATTMQAIKLFRKKVTVSLGFGSSAGRSTVAPKCRPQQPNRGQDADPAAQVEDGRSQSGKLVRGLTKRIGTFVEKVTIKSKPNESSLSLESPKNSFFISGRVHSQPTAMSPVGPTSALTEVN